MKHRSLLATVATLSIVAILAVTPRTARAWGEVGHKVVARIAWNNMKPDTRAKLISLLNDAPKDADLASLRPSGLSEEDANRALFEAAACWPDIVRAQKTDAEKTRRAKYHHSPWHYYDVYFEQTADGAIKERTDKKNAPENSIERLGVLTAQLGNTALPAGERAVALAWIEHLVGDVHTPLHNVARVSAAEPDGDQGGNLFKLEENPAPGKQYATNLHSFWDDLPESQFPLSPGEDPEARVGRVAQAATFLLPKALFERAGLTQTAQYAQWNREGAEVAIAKVYPNLKRNQLPDAPYTQEAKNTAVIALAKAGYRLAATLEAALAAEK
ncbi:MAG: S1/P1 nuclease [Akkermansiaceae bacterium]|nr:S1/P1 nuclease [Armatimonadota bacterium]